MSTPAQIMTAMATGLATVTNLSASRVTVNDPFAIRNQPYSVVILPSLGGQQSLAEVGGWQLLHRIRVRLSVKHASVAELHDRCAAMIPLILAWFRANDDLGLADVLTCHLGGAPLTWDSPTGDAVVDDAGVLSRDIDFVVTVVTFA